MQVNQSLLYSKLKSFEAYAKRKERQRQRKAQIERGDAQRFGDEV